MRFLGLSCVLCFFPIICAAAPVLSSHRDVSVPVRGKTGGYQSNPLVVSSQNGFLLLWIHRDRSALDYFQPSRLLALRADTNGVPLDSAPIIVSESPSLIERPALASDGTNYFVAWLDGRGTNFLSLYVTRVTSSGVVTSPQGTRLEANPSGLPRLVSGAEGSFVLWRDWSADEVRGARISSAGVVLDLSSVSLSFLPNSGGALGTDGSNHVFVTSQFDSFSGSFATRRWRIAQANASVSSAAHIADSQSSVEEFSLAFNGARFLLVTRSSSSNTAFFLNPDGTLLGPGPALAEGYRWHQVTSSRGEFSMASYSSSDRVDFARYSGTGALLATNALNLDVNANASDNSFASGFHVSILFRWDPTTDQLLASVLRSDGSIRNHFSPQGPNQQHRPALVSDGSGYLVAWDEERDGSNMVFALRVDAQGYPIPPGALPCGEGYGVQVAYGSGIFFLIWETPEFAVFGRRLRQNGTWLDPAPFLLRSNSFSPAIAGGSTNFLFAWHIYTNIELEVHGSIISTNDTLVISPSFEISNPGPRIQSSPEIVFNGTDYVVAWNAYQPSFFYAFVGWKLVSPGGQLLSGGATPLDAAGPRLARAGDSVWLSWDHFSFGGFSDSNRRLAQISTNGSQLIPSEGAIVDILPESLAGFGGTLWTAGTISIFDSNTFTSHVAFSAFHSPSNLAVAPFRLEEDSNQPSLASNGTNVLCAYRSPGSSFNHPGTPRVRLRVIYPETTFHVTRAAGLRLSGSAQHPFLIEQSAELVVWQPFRTNITAGPFDYPAPNGAKQFFRLRWYPP